ncbi:MAG: NAD(P)-binding protein [Candidatus Micrarchaeales archaeon]|jgi:voltage-gated potassium channel
MQTSKEDTFNVMILTLGITLVVVVCSIIALWLVTKNPYLDSYFTLESFFDVQNTAASTDLAAIAFTMGTGELISILIIVIVDNLSRILILSFIMAAVIDFLNYANVEGLINDFKSRTLKNHVILCGYNEIGERLIKKFNAQKTKYIVVEPKGAEETKLNEEKILNIVGDFTEEPVLKKARIENAQAIVFISENDVDNIVGSLVARRLNPKIKIMGRIGDDSIRKRVYGIGMDMAVIPEHLAGLEMGEFMFKAYGA